MGAKTRRILVVEDEPAIREAVVVFLSHLNYRMDQAENGIEALHYIKSNSYDLIILDIKMPYINGRQLMEILAENRIRIPVLVMSAVAQAEVLFQEKGRLEKTFDLKTLREKVEEILGLE